MTEQKIIPSEVKVVRLEEEILAANDVVAAENRELLRQKSVYTINLISSPGSGKTTLLVETLKALQGKLRCAVIEGDQQTSNDADRIAQTGVPVVQINTIGNCHLDAPLVQKALAQLPLDEIDLLFIENVGNLVCPAGYDLGEQEKVVVMSVTEGEDKPIKYPLAFHLATVMVLTKIDLLPYLKFDKDLCIEMAHRIHPGIPVIETSCYTKEGLADWVDWLLKKCA
ncbi:MAG TPA: hydrogenase nickel incorporation protein HypB [Anaerolineaceae bacterium]|nr:hydrogenase nickel incorporation protein HypB [Anaerolineaceae bacterium]HPC05991.1 hydrogenase nickel incorporation protein HypB [Anaerolineaceae bacterium]HQP08726.1 hydrogenase nickel incorporation protein HypB [Anaerolineaceae bacterium]